MQLLSGNGLREPQFIRVQGGAGDEIFVLRTVEPVACKGMAEVGHVDAELVCAPRLGPQAEESKAFGRLQYFVFRAAYKAVLANAAADDGAIRTTDGRVDDAARRRNLPDGDGAILTPQLA